VKECVVADAVAIEPVSASKFPANREINREFCEILAAATLFAPQSASKFNGFERNSLSKVTGNFLRVTGNWLPQNREMQEGWKPGELGLRGKPFSGLGNEFAPEVARLA
jgi:hypothetical protein